jgi:hypothetical protein
LISQYFDALSHTLSDGYEAGLLCWGRFWQRSVASNSAASAATFASNRMSPWQGRPASQSPLKVRSKLPPRQHLRHAQNLAALQRRVAGDGAQFALPGCAAQLFGQKLHGGGGQGFAVANEGVALLG